MAWHQWLIDTPIPHIPRVTAFLQASWTLLVTPAPAALQVPHLHGAFDREMAGLEERETQASLEHGPVTMYMTIYVAI